MTTAYSALLLLAGLSHREAAEFHEVRQDTVSSWSAGRNRAPLGAIDELRSLAERQERAAEEGAKLIRRQKPKPEQVEIGIAADDHEAQSLGWPCVGAQAASLARLIAKLPGMQVRIVPCGSTPSTAAAADVHGR